MVIAPPETPQNIQAVSVTPIEPDAPSPAPIPPTPLQPATALPQTPEPLAATIPTYSYSRHQLLPAVIPIQRQISKFGVK